MYLTYDEYKELGGTADQPSFSNLELQARYKLDYWTMNRIAEPDEGVKLCMTLLINVLAEVQNGESDVSSFSNDGVSVTLANAKTDEQKMNDVYSRVVEMLPVELVSVVVT